jgi:arylsulfatase
MNFVFIVLDTLRGDRLGCYDYWRKDISPRIDRIAAEGVRFTQCYASGIPTGAGFSCLHTGLTCCKHRFYLTPWGEPNVINFDDRIPMAADFFLDNGYTTAAVDNLVNFGAHMKQFCRGYNYYLNCTPVSLSFHHHVTADQVNAMALPWLRANGKEKPFFLWLHYWDPHNPYNHPTESRGHYRHTKYSTEGLPKVATKAGYEFVPGWGAAHRIDEGDSYGEKCKEDLSHDYYDEEVRYVDDRVGKVYDTLSELGILEDTCVVIASDHGEELGQHHQYWLHKYLYESTNYLPLIVRYPKRIPAGKIVDGFVQQIDIVPTMLDLAGIEPRMRRLEGPGDPARFDGHSLMPMIRGEAAGRPFAFTEGGANWQYSRSLLMPDGWKIIWHAYKDEVELYNVHDDPAEIVNLADREIAKRDELLSMLKAHVEELLAGRTDMIPRAGSEHDWPLQYFTEVLLKRREIRK